MRYEGEREARYIEGRDWAGIAYRDLEGRVVKVRPTQFTNINIQFRPVHIYIHKATKYTHTIHKYRLWLC